MKLTQIRNATNRLEYAGTTFLIDPWLAPKHTLSFVDIPGMPYHIPDPVQSLPEAAPSGPYHQSHYVPNALVPTLSDMDCTDRTNVFSHHIRKNHSDH